MQRPVNLLEFTLGSLWRRKYKHLALILVYALIVATLGSVLFLTTALKHEATVSLVDAPEIVVQQIVAGRHDLTPVSAAALIEKFPGVAAVTPRVWGYYYDSLIRANLTLIGLSGQHQHLDLLEGRLPEQATECAIGQGVAEAFGPGLGDLLVLENSAKQRAEYRITGLFRAESNLLTNDLVVMSDAAIRQFFSIDDSLATDLAVRVRNPREIGTIAKKISYNLPRSRPITRDEIMHTYDTLFNWRSGMLLAVSVAALIAFCILAWDRATGLNAEEKREIGVLKAIGWETSDILGIKFWEGLVISVTAFLLGVIAAWFHVFVLGAPALTPLLKGWSVLFPEFRLTAVIDYYQLLVLAVLSIVPYLVCTLVPSWKAAVTDPEQILRGE